MMASDPYRSSIYRVTFGVASGERQAFLYVSHPAARQSLKLWLYPSNAVPEALPLVEEGFAHYMAQWPKFMVDDVSVDDCRGFYLEAKEVPPRIADPDNTAALTEIGLRHMPDVWARISRQMSTPALVPWPEPEFVHNWDPYTSAAEIGIIPWPRAPSSTQ
jgi:hypothetical protein